MLLTTLLTTVQINLRSLPLRGALWSSVVMAFAGLGDAFLYPVLPVYGKEMGFSVLVIGLLLSINRFVRIVANTPIANIVRKLGMKKVLVTCSLLACFTTFIYGFQTGLVVFLLARILWGLCYSGLKIATLNYAAQVKKKSSLAFGLAQSIYSLGALFVLWLGPLLVQDYGVETGIYVIAAISALGIPVALTLPSITPGKQENKVKTHATFKPSSLNLLVFALSVTLDGILVVSLAHLFQPALADSSKLLAVVAFYLLLKKLFTTFLSLVGGILSLHIRTDLLYRTAVLVCIAALIMIALDGVIAGVITAFLFNTVIITFSPWMAIQQDSTQKNSLQAISGVATWWDLGAAIGALTGLYLINFFGSKTLFLALSLGILILFVNFVLRHGNTNSRIV